MNESGMKAKITGGLIGVQRDTSANLQPSQPMVAASLDALHMSLIDLGERMRGFEDSLRPVLLPAQSKLDGSSNGAPETVRSPVDQAIHSAWVQVIALNEHLRDIGIRLTV